jgi:RNA polymerase sigma-70 factor (ECF subfamily)
LADAATDETLLARARAGDETAFLGLYERHRDTVFRFAYRMLGSAESAEDVAHDCFVGLLSGPARFDASRASLRTYLCGAARHLVFKRFRAAGREVLTDLVEEQVAEDPPPDGLLGSEIVSRVRAAVAALPPLQREAIVLVEYEGCALSEVAAIVGAEVGTVKARLHRGRETLRRRLACLRAGPAVGAGGG